MSNPRSRIVKAFVLLLCSTLVAHAATSDFLSTVSPKLKEFLAKNPAASNTLYEVLTVQQTARKYGLVYFYTTNVLISAAQHSYLADDVVAIAVREDQEPIDEYLCLTFELLNSSNEPKFAQIVDDARKNNLSREDFAKRFVETEFIAVKKLKSLLPKMKLDPKVTSSSSYYTNFQNIPDSFEQFYAQTQERSGGWDYLKRYQSYYDLYQPNAVDYRTRGYQLAQQGDLDGALTNFLAAIKNDPKDTYSLCNLGKLYSLKTNNVTALEYLNRAVQLDTNNAGAYNMRAWVYSCEANYPKAAADYAAAVRINPNDPHLQGNLAFAYLEMKDGSNAIAACERALDLDPQSTKMRLLHGSASALLGNWKGAENDFSAAMKLEPENANAINSLAWLRATCPDAAMRNGVSALNLAAKACELTQWSDSQKFETLAAAYAEVGKFDEAVTYQRKALELAGESSGVAQQYEQRIEAYKSHKPHRWSPKTE